jgi:hypothetical protein
VRSQWRSHFVITCTEPTWVTWPSRAAQPGVAPPCRCATRGRRPLPAKVKIILVNVKMILTFAGIIHSRVGQLRAGGRHLNVTISASQVPLPGPVAMKARSGWSASHASHQHRHSGSLTGQATGRAGMRLRDRLRQRIARPGNGDRLIRWSSMVSGFLPAGCVVVPVGRSFTTGALLSDRCGLAMIRAAP